MGRFVLWTFCPLDILSLGPYVPGTFCPLGRFVLGRFVHMCTELYTFSSNFNSGSDRLCEGIVQTRSKDDSFDSTLAIYIQLIIYAIYCTLSAIEKLYCTREDFLKLN